MSLIDQSYFRGEVNLPNLDKRINTFNSFLDQYEKEILIDLLGLELYDLFIAGLAVQPTVDQKWLDLRDGADFDLNYNGRIIKLHWIGLKNLDKKSLIAYYAYHKIRKSETSTTTSVNEVRGKLENSKTVNESRKLINAWNLMLKSYGETFYFDKYSTEYDTYNDSPSAFNFLNMNRDVYPGWIFSPHYRMNEFGI